MDRPAFQEQIPGNHCWGCGAENPDGLGIKSRWLEEGARSICTFDPRPEHAAGPRTVLNGGIIATLIDCHSVCSAIAATYHADGREIGSDPIVWCVTASLHIDYLKPTPIDEPVELTASVRIEGRKARVACSLASGDTERARGDVLTVRVPEGWLTDGPPL